MARIREKTLKFPGLNNTYTFADEADLFDANVDCAVGEYRIYNGDLYCCTTTHTGAWDASHFKAVKMGKEVSEIKTALNAVDSEQTTFISRLSNNYFDTSITSIDANAKTFNGYYVNGSNEFVQNASLNTYAVRCPYGGFTFKSTASKIVVTKDYPSTDSTSISVISTLTSSKNFSAEYTVQEEGAIIVFCIGTSDVFYLLTKNKNIVKISNLELDSSRDVFKINSVVDDDVSDIGNDKLNITKVEGMLVVSTTGGYDTNASYDTYYFQVPTSQLTINCTNGFRAAIGYKEPSRYNSTENLKTLIYQYAAGIVETFTANYGEWVAISVAKSSGGIALKTDYIKRFELPALRLGYRQSERFYKFIENTDGKFLYVYFKSGNKYVRWELHNVPSNLNNSNTWQLGKVSGLVEDLSSEIELVTSGEFELAFKEHGASDFCGGNNHGDENTDSFSLFIDGKLVSDFDDLDGKFHAFNRIDAIEIATVNRCDTPDTNILKHQKVWAFEGNTVRVKQTVKFLTELQVDGMLICMLAANRSSYDNGVRQGGIAVEDLSTSSYSPIRTKTNDMFYLMFGDNATAKVSAKSFNEDSDSGLWINPTSTMNKLYYTYWESANSTYPVTVSENTILNWESEYDIAYN